MFRTRYEIRATSHGFTLIELLVAMVITGIVLSAVATLAFALGSAHNITSDISSKQAQIRFASLRINELIRHCKLICYTGSADTALWKADENNDGKINISELVYIEYGTSRNHLQLCEFPSSDNSAINPGAIAAFATNWWTAYSSSVNYTKLLPQCSNVQLGFDVLPPQSKFVNISFDIVESNVSHRYEINATLRGYAKNLLSSDGLSIVSDDD
jgi:prepilin-type N-terminal cleavage/methylation domain-containing protein